MTVFVPHNGVNVMFYKLNADNSCAAVENFTSLEAQTHNNSSFNYHPLPQYHVYKSLNNPPSIKISAVLFLFADNRDRNLGAASSPSVAVGVILLGVGVALLAGRPLPLLTLARLLVPVGLFLDLVADSAAFDMTEVGVRTGGGGTDSAAFDMTEVGVRTGGGGTDSVKIMRNIHHIYQEKPHQFHSENNYHN
jgi:hypothetical protein